MDNIDNFGYVTIGEGNGGNNNRHHVLIAICVCLSLVAIVALVLFVTKGKKIENLEGSNEDVTSSLSSTAASTPEIIVMPVQEFEMPTTERITFDQQKGTTEELLEFKNAVASSAKGDGLVGTKTVSRQPKCAKDLDIETSWQEASTGDGSGESITLRFSKERTVKYLNMFLGNWRVPISGIDFYANNNSPKKMTMIINGQKYAMNFSRKKVMQRVVFETPVKTKEITLIIDSVYKGADGENDCCISEIIAIGY